MTPAVFWQLEARDFVLCLEAWRQSQGEPFDRGALEKLLERNGQ
ncbi:phage tail assembly chaperone [Parvularcula marina]